MKVARLSLERLLSNEVSSDVFPTIDTTFRPMRGSGQIESKELKLADLVHPVSQRDVYVELKLSELIQKPSKPVQQRPFLLSEMLQPLSHTSDEIVTTPVFSLEQELFGVNTNSSGPNTRNQTN